jgi:excisionase family DNA binding protein
MFFVMEENLLSVAQVAEKRGVTVGRIHQLIKDGTLAAQKYGNQYLVKETDADALIIHGKAGRPPKEKINSK